jgi:hypothetical protein
MMAMLSAFDDPQIIAAVLGFSFGYLYGESFSNFDESVKYGNTWYPSLNPVLKWFIASLLDVNHHFQYGLVLMLITYLHTLPPLWPIILWWAGAGLVVSDWKDYQFVLERMGLVSQSQNIVDKTKGGNEKR